MNKTAEWIELLQLVKQLPEPLKREIYIISEGARLVAEMKKQEAEGKAVQG